MYMAYLFIHNLDRRRYGDFIDKFRSDYSFHYEGVYLKTLEEAAHRASEHKIRRSDDRSGNNSSSTKASNNNKSGGGNNKDDDEGSQLLDLSFAQMDGRCFCCGREGHKADTCKHKSKPKSEWAMNKAYNNMQKEVQEKKAFQNFLQSQQQGSSGSSPGTTTGTSVWK